MIPEQFSHYACVDQQYIGVLYHLMIQDNSMCPAFHFAWHTHTEGSPTANLTILNSSTYIQTIEVNLQHKKLLKLFRQTAMKSEYTQN